MRSKVIDGKGSMYFVLQQATKFTRQEMRDVSPSGPVKMDSMMGRSFTFPFLITSCIVALSGVYAIDWLAVQVSTWLV